jgi:hypothetical protein
MRFLLYLVLAVPVFSQLNPISPLNNWDGLPQKGLVAVYRLGGIDGGVQTTGARWTERKRNLLNWSEAFDNVAWTAAGEQVTVSANATQAPDGQNTADKLVETAVTYEHYLAQVSAIGTGVRYTWSIFAKAVERQWIVLSMWDNGAVIRRAWFDVGTGTLGTAQPTVTSSILSVGSGWFRCSFSLPSALANTSVYIGLSTGDNNLSYAGDGSSGLYIWGGQLTPGAGGGYESYEKTEANQVVWDYSGNGNHAQRGSTTGADTHDPSFAVEGEKVVGMGFYGNDYLVRATTPVVAQPLTLTTSHKTTDFGDARVYFAGDEPVDNAAMFLTITIGKLALYAGATLLGSASTAGVYEASTGIFQGVTSLIFRNGLQVGSGNGGIQGLSGWRTGIDSDGASYGYVGTISLQALYSRALSTVEISRIYRLLKRVQPELALP